MRRWWIWGAGAVALVAVAAVVASFFVDEPLRRSLERQLNARLQGYTVPSVPWTSTRSAFPSTWKT